MLIEDNYEIWRKYYEAALSRRHHDRTERALTLNKAKLKVAIDCGCGTGADIEYITQQGYNVHGFDINPDSVLICQSRFEKHERVDVKQASFESYDYPRCGVIIANSSLFFADPSSFDATWRKIKSSIEFGGVFAGDFMGKKDSWAENYRTPTTALTIYQVQSLFIDFEIVEFSERSEDGATALGMKKHWHTFSVLAVKSH